MQISSPAAASRPRIGIPLRLSSSSDPDPRVAEANGLFDYIVDLVREGGGEPVPLSSTEGLGGLDGVVLPGGGDLDPRLYGETPGGTCYDVNPAQDDLDLAVARQSIEAGLPLLGICRGHQLLNVIYGGTLIQDMDPGSVPHQEPEPVHELGPWAWHAVAISAGSKVAALYAPPAGAAAGERHPEGAGEEAGDGADERSPLTVKIASGHHQAVARVADGLVVTAVADDGTVEALEDPQRWVASVQWHPEALELPAAERLAPFRAFVDVCRNGATAG
ncbi:gamma-glutamyl-gamma-aminobutyrate hydrolase family protein [Arthrobacter sp. B3I4]|uniref:gamma-glutamyl-gamma-aminobutyrate hydrolase family protein n=1 Tax=Arthrobacter sp. B3I4 TaxID=3042267 RepID=UPI002783A11C|nr:type 1 glutamine amidotransferase [Arthrobacter sp. B3I4]MDQ0754059.1 putative glutamine amidotransferase [Arthrobacter sp. B3I4]